MTQENNLTHDEYETIYQIEPNLRNRIFEALHQYPKLKEELDLIKRNWDRGSMSAVEIRAKDIQSVQQIKDENQKLKAENEELKKHLPDMTKWTIGLIIKELEEHPEYTASEILKRHKELYFGSPASKYLEELEESNKAHIEACGQWNEKYYSLQQENNQLKAENEALKKLPSTSGNVSETRKPTIKKIIEENNELKQLKQRVEGLNDFVNKINCKNNILFEEFLVYIKSELQQLLKDDIK